MALKLRVATAFLAAALHAESGHDAWLRYAPADSNSHRENIPAVITALGHSDLIDSAQQEVIRGLRGMIGRTLRIESRLPNESAIVLGTLADIGKDAPQWHLAANLKLDGYWLKTIQTNGASYTVVTASNARGVLYGAFAFLRKFALNEPIHDLDEQQTPRAPVRWVNQWDNLDGSIERGYGGRSIFWEGMHAREDISRVKDYGRLLASVGINACAINNVNANARVLASDFIASDVARIAGALRP